LFGWLGQHPEVMTGFAEAMKANADSESHNVSHAAAGYNWKGLGAGLAAGVSISSLISIKILTFAAPKLQIIVQDLPEIVSRAKQRCQQH